MTNQPLVSIIILAYNEEKSISKSIDSAINQSYSNIEILVCDNASQDKTTEIISEYAKKYSFVRHILRSRNIGAFKNQILGIVEAKGEYFVMFGGHDLTSNNYIEELVSTLQNSSNAVLAMGKTIWIDAFGARVIERKSSLLSTEGLSPLSTYLSIALQNQHYLYGCISRSAYLSCKQLQRSVNPGSGELILQELATKGDFVINTNAIWYRRLNRRPEFITERMTRYRNMLTETPQERLLFSIFPMTHYLLNYFLQPFLIFKGYESVKISLIALPLIVSKAPKCLIADFLFFFHLVKLKLNHVLSL